MPRESMKAWDDARKAREADPDNPLLIDAEYAAEREHFRRVDLAQRWRRVAVYLIVSFAFLVLATVAGKQQAKINDTVDAVARLSVQNRTLTKSLQSAIVESCEKNGNARAKVQREQINEEIYENEHPNPQAFKALVDAGVSAQAIYEAEARAIVTLKERLDRIQIVNCEAEYKIGPDTATQRQVRNLGIAQP